MWQKWSEKLLSFLIPTTFLSHFSPKVLCLLLLNLCSKNICITCLGCSYSHPVESGASLKVLHQVCLYFLLSLGSHSRNTSGPQKWERLKNSQGNPGPVVDRSQWILFRQNILGNICAFLRRSSQKQLLLPTVMTSILNIYVLFFLISCLTFPGIPLWLFKTILKINNASQILFSGSLVENQGNWRSLQ